MRIGWSLYGTVVFVSVLSSSNMYAQNKDIVGRIEKVRIYPGDLVLRAKIDTGAKNSSLHAASLTKFEKNGETWVRFSVKNHLEEEATIERKVIRVAKLKQKGRDTERRPVIMLGICLGRQYREVEVNLVDRARFIYPILIGRSYMRGHLVVDPELKYTAQPNCVGAPMP
jgi:hypothetical protein